MNYKEFAIALIGDKKLDVPLTEDSISAVERAIAGIKGYNDRWFDILRRVVVDKERPIDVATTYGTNIRAIARCRRNCRKIIMDYYNDKLMYDTHLNDKAYHDEVGTRVLKDVRLASSISHDRVIAALLQIRDSDYESYDVYVRLILLKQNVDEIASVKNRTATYIYESIIHTRRRVRLLIVPD